MSFLDERSTGEKVGGVLAFLVAAVVVRAVMGGGIDYFANSPPRTEIQLQALINEDPNLAPAYALMAKEFPEEYADFRSHMLDVVQTSGSHEQAFAEGKRLMGDFFTAHAADLQRAPQAELFESRDRSIEVIEMLSRESTEMCAHFAISGLGPADHPGDKTLRKIGQAITAQFQAVAAGMKRPVDRGQPTEQDIREFSTALSADGLTEQEVGMVLQGGPALNALDAGTQCRMGLALYRGLARLPAGASERVSSVVLSPTV